MVPKPISDQIAQFQGFGLKPQSSRLDLQVEFAAEKATPRIGIRWAGNRLGRGQLTVRNWAPLVPPLEQPRLPELPEGVCTTTL